MSIFDLFSKRQMRSRGEMPDVYVYETIPSKLKVQIVHILSDRLGYDEHRHYDTVKSAFHMITSSLRREYGVFFLPPRTTQFESDEAAELFNFFLNEQDTEKCIDVIELSFRFIDKLTRNYEFKYERNYDELATAAIDELNGRFKESGFGYQYVDGEIIRIDSELIHAEAVKPALRLLNTKAYRGPHDEFISAYSHYRHGKNKEALNDCLKALESTMKAICSKRGWSYSETDNAKKLIEVCFNNGLIPTFWQGQLGSLRSLLESSIPTGRNKLSGHGQGAVPSSVPDHIAAYMLHMTASTLVFLTSAEKSLP